MSAVFHVDPLKPLAIDLYCSLVGELKLHFRLWLWWIARRCGWQQWKLESMLRVFQAYLITCKVSDKRYVGITSRSPLTRLAQHVRDARLKPKTGALFAAIAKYGAQQFSIESICCARSWEDICAIEVLLIHQHATLAPGGYNLTFGGEGRNGYRPTKEAVERSAAKHRGRPCHENTRTASRAAHLGKPKSAQHRARIASAKRGVARSESTKTKIRAYWAARRDRGEFKTSTQYAHKRKTPEGSP